MLVLPAYNLPQQIRPLSYSMQCHCIELLRLKNTQASPIFSCLSCLFFFIRSITFLHFVGSLPFLALLCHSFNVLSSFYSLHFPFFTFFSHFCPPVLSAKGKPLPLSHGKSRNGRIRSDKLRETHLSLSVAVPSVALTRFHILPLQAFESLLQLYEARATYEELCIPMCMLPATISNNVPGTDLSIGADTALNAIVEVRQSNRRLHNLCS